MSAKFGRHRGNLTPISTESGQHAPEIGNIRPGLGQVCPCFDPPETLGPTQANCGIRLDWAKLCLASAGSREAAPIAARSLGEGTASRRDALQAIARPPPGRADRRRESAWLRPQATSPRRRRRHAEASRCDGELSVDLLSCSCLLHAARVRGWCVLRQRLRRTDIHSGALGSVDSGGPPE